MVVLRASDGKCYTGIDSEIVQRLVDSTEKNGEEKVISLPISSEALGLIHRYCEHHRGDVTESGPRRYLNGYSDFDLSLVKEICESKELMFEVIIACAYLQVDGLVKLMSVVAFEIIKSWDFDVEKSMSFLRDFEAYREKNDLTDEKASIEDKPSSDDKAI